MKRFVLRSIGLMLLLAAAIAFLAPREPVDTQIAFDPAVIGADVDAYLRDREARFDDITPGVEKRVIWAGTPGAQTDLAVVYIHGFSASSEELRPVPDQVAEALGANLFFTRLRGHGRGGLAMAEPEAGDWLEDVAEALAIGRRIGREVIVMAMSTGGTAAAVTATIPSQMEDVRGIVFVSPNFRVNTPGDLVFEWPLARLWGLILAGAERGIAPQNDDHAKYWTTLYPSEALITMSALVRFARNASYGAVKLPALFLFSDDDAVVSAEATRAFSTRWGGPVTVEPRFLGPADDPFRHVIAGDILSPSQTAGTVEVILNWIGDI